MSMLCLLCQNQFVQAHGEREAASKQQGTAESMHDGLITAGSAWNVVAAQPQRAPQWEESTTPLSKAGRAFLNGRGISDKVIAANDIRTANRSFRVESGWETFECVAFPYKREGDVVNVKYRSLQGMLSRPVLVQSRIYF